MQFEPSEPCRPANCWPNNPKNRWTVTAASASADGKQWRITSDSGRTILWTRQHGLYPWRPRLEVSHAK